MIIFPLANASASVISVSTAASLLSLINTAGSVTHAYRQNLDAVDITPEDGDIRIILDNSASPVSPTATKGFLVKQGMTLMLRMMPLTGLRLVATSGTVSCSVQIGTSEMYETSVLTGGATTTAGTTPSTPIYISDISPLNAQYSLSTTYGQAALPIGTYYYPSSAGISMDGYKDLAVDFSLASANAVLTVESGVADLTTAGNVRDITRSGFENRTATTNNASYTNAVGQVDFDNLNAPLVRVKIVVSTAATNVYVTLRRKAL